MKFGSSGQDYLEAIFELSIMNSAVRSVDVAEKLGVTRSSVNRAVGVLKDLGYVIQEKYSGIMLTPEGRSAAGKIKSRHNTLKKFLMDELGVDDATAEEDACRMEHCISLQTFDKLQKYMEGLDHSI